ncbi:hypothetical protein IW139_005387, partial [Coemansia sp. RSA 353]
MYRKISRIATRQKYSPSTINGDPGAQLPISSASGSDKLQHSLAKLEIVAMHNNDRAKRAANTAARILEEAETEL